MTEVVTVKVPTVKCLFFLLPFHIVFFGRKSHSPQLRSGSFAPPPSGHSSHTHDLEFFCMGDFFLLYTLGCNTIPLYFVIQIIPVWPLGANSQLIPMSLWHILTILFLLLFFFSLRNCLLLSDTTNVLGSSYKFPAPVLKSTISPRSLGSFHRKMVLETKIQESRFFLSLMFIKTCLVLFLPTVNPSLVF